MFRDNPSILHDVKVTTIQTESLSMCSKSVDRYYGKNNLKLQPSNFEFYEPKIRILGEFYRKLVFGFSRDQKCFKM